jgi:hypothetical protein
MNIAEIKKIMDGWESGQEIEYRRKSRPSHDWIRMYAPVWNFEDCEYRFKAAPKLRQLRPDEFPPVVWLHDGPNHRLVVHIDAHGIGYFDLISEKVKSLLFSSTEIKKYQWSTDRKNPRNFFVEDNG